jgi:hypothetical protein
MSSAAASAPPAPAGPPATVHRLKQRRHYDGILADTPVPDIGQRPFAKSPSRAFNHMQNVETTPRVRSIEPSKYANGMQNAESTPRDARVPGWASRINAGSMREILSGEGPSVPTRRVAKGVAAPEPTIAARPVRFVSGGSTTLRSDIQ